MQFCRSFWLKCNGSTMYVVFLSSHWACFSIDNILKLMSVWRIAGKIIRITIIVNCICTCIMEFLYFRFGSFFCVLCFCKV